MPYLDFVDNHWIALWFGLYVASSIDDGDTFVRYTKRSIDIAGCSVGNHLASCEENYQYLILLAVDKETVKPVIKSIRYGERTVLINLRNALPSLFLRPHSQHGYVVKKRTQSGDFDLSTEVVGILRMRIDYVSEWLGNGLLTTVNSIFPEPAADYAYRVLLKHKDFFCGTKIKIPYNV